VILCASGHPSLVYGKMRIRTEQVLLDEKGSGKTFNKWNIKGILVLYTVHLYICYECGHEILYFEIELSRLGKTMESHKTQ
jgi:hypothetical protein